MEHFTCSKTLSFISVRMEELITVKCTCITAEMYWDNTSWGSYDSISQVWDRTRKLHCLRNAVNQIEERWKYMGFSAFRFSLLFGSSSVAKHSFDALSVCDRLPEMRQLDSILFQPMHHNWDIKPCCLACPWVNAYKHSFPLDSEKSSPWHGSIGFPP